MTHYRKPLAFFFAGAVALAPAGYASAQSDEIVVTGKAKAPPGQELVTRKVSIADLDLATAKGAEEMEERVEAAVKEICWYHPKPARWQVKQSEECSEFAWADARPQMEQALAKARSD